LLFLLTTQVRAYETVAVLSGTGKVIDGDGILFGEIEVRLQGIAAPEAGSHKVEPGGRESTENLRKLVDGKLVTCHLDGSVAGRTQRPAGICFVDGIETNRYQVETGNARDCPAYSKGRYHDAEMDARKAGNDLSRTYDLPTYCR
jgi:endonuclease YncB( thermonuclease family)